VSAESEVVGRERAIGGDDVAKVAGDGAVVADVVARDAAQVAAEES